MDGRIWGVVLATWSLLACGETSSDGVAGAAGSGGDAGAVGSSGDAGSAGSGVAIDGLAGAATAGAAGNGGVHLGTGSWEVTGVVTVEPEQAYFCEKIDFALTVDGDTITVGRDGVMHSAPVQIVDGAYLATSLELPKGSCNADQLLVNQLRLHGVDNDGDGEADALEATATLDQVYIVSGDSGTYAKVSIAFKALPDDSQPKLSAHWEMANPLDRVEVIASEPVDASTKVTLTGTSTLPLVATQVSDPPPSGAVIGFYSSQILPLGGTWQLEAEGKDLAGHALALDATSSPLSTLTDPGVYTPDGFEGALSGVSGSSQTVTGYGSVPAISGEHSLWLEPSSQLLIHLRRQSNEKNLHFVVRGFAASNGQVNATKNVRAGVVGGTQVVTLEPKYPLPEARDATGDVSLPWVGGALEFDAVLDEPGQDVLLSISNSYCQDFFFGCRPSAWMIDDLTLE